MYFNESLYELGNTLNPHVKCQDLPVISQLIIAKTIVIKI